MFVDSIKKTKKGKYKIKIQEREYELFEDTIFHFRMVEGHETTEEEIKEALEYDSFSKYYAKAVDYSLKYAKGEKEVRVYLKKKELSKMAIQKIIERMKDARVLNDDLLLDSLIQSYIRQSNGRELIKAKLLNKGFSKEDIENHLNHMDMDLYFEALEKLYKKSYHKYDKYDPHMRILKLKKYLLSRGYTYSEIDNLSLN